MKLTADEIEARKHTAALRKKPVEMERLARKRKRKELRQQLAEHKDVIYYHFRAGPGYNRHIQPKGGICVAVWRIQSAIFAGVSICASGDTYDKLEARRYASDRVLNRGGFKNAFGCLSLESTRLGGLQLEGIVRRLAVLAAENAVACLNKKRDREWFEENVLPWLQG